VATQRILRRAAAAVAVIIIVAPSPALAALGDCGQPVTTGANPTASDCLFILRAAVGTATCEQACICDTNGAGGTTATDALLCLKKAVGQAVSLDCPCTTTSTTSPITTTTAAGSGVVLRGVLPKTTGRFNFNLEIGLPAADAACNAEFAGTHACTFADLLAAETAGDLDGIKDTHAKPVSSFWAINSSHPDNTQCHQTIAWDYQTAHTGVRAEVATLDNASGDLGAATDGVCAQQNWVGCCL